MPAADLVLTGGRVVDPSRDIDMIADVAFADGKVSAIGPNLSRNGTGDIREVIRGLVQAMRAMFDRPEVRVALPGLIADTVADPELHKLMIARLAGNLSAFESRFGQRRRDDDELPLLAEVVAGTAIFRILIRPDAVLDDAWVDAMTELITERWPVANSSARQRS